MSITEVFDHLRIPFDDMKSATNNFGDSNCIGQGGFGKVYRGELELDHSGQHVSVAVKRLDSRFGQGSTEFWQEIDVLSHYKHENIVSLLGFCNEVNENILVYEYLPNKSLDAHLSSPYLSWIDRLNICIGAARGLKHLQKSHGKIVLHRDIKSSNILLDANWDAKISDFGLSKTIVVSKESPFNISSPAGTHGYCDPHDLEFLTEKYDVYSFGVVLFEVLSGRLCTEKFKPLLSKLARTYYEKNKIHEIVLGDLKDQISPISLAKFSAIAYECLQRDRNKRPSISEITRELKDALVCQMEHNFWQEGTLDPNTLFPLIKNTQIYNSRFVSLAKKTAINVIGGIFVHKDTPIWPHFESE